MFVRNAHGVVLLLLNGYTYSKASASRNNKSWWKCSAKHATLCPASLTTQNNLITKMNGKNHNHPPRKYEIDEHGTYCKIR